MKNIIKLALSKTLATSANVQDFTSDFTGDLGIAMQQALKQEREEAQKAASAELLQMVKDLKAIKELRIQNIRSYQAQIKEQKTALDLVDRAFAYGNETYNFTPLLCALGKTNHVAVSRDLHITHTEAIALCEVPAGWKPAAG